MYDDLFYEPQIDAYWFIRPSQSVDELYSKTSASLQFVTYLVRER